MSSLSLLLPLFLLLSSTTAADHSLQNPNIINGKSTTIEKFPYQASIEFKGKHICGASIIGQYYLLSAAHCFPDKTKKNHFMVRVGSTKRENGGQLFGVRYISKHNLYGIIEEFCGSKSFDVAIVWLRGNLIFSKTIKPIRLPSPNDKLPVNNVGIVSGWGQLWEECPLADNLQYVKVPIWDKKKCLKAFGFRKIDDVMFCAGNDIKSMDACKGDSGGPFISDGKIYGIVSWGKGCGRVGKPGVYTNVINLLEWIQLTLKAGPIGS